jgi:predicted RND superfamily exporter protein
MESEVSFLANAIQGVLISISFGYIILILFTGNIVISTYAILCCGFIMFGVVMVMQVNGWEVGVSESLGVVILIGFSIDYVVHLSAHYVHSPFYGRQERMQHAFKEMAVSIFSGALTTLGAGIFLYPALLRIFRKFSIIIVFTVIFALFYSLLFFGALAHALGTQGKQGELGACCEKKKHDPLEFEEDDKKNGKPTTVN